MKFRQFICGSTEHSTEERFVCAPYLRKAFFLDSAGEGKLSVCGTVNDVSVCGGAAKYLSCSF